MGTAIKHSVPDRVKPSFVIFDIRAPLVSDAQPWASECPVVKNYKWRHIPVWHKMLWSCTHMATVGVKGLMWSTVNLNRSESALNGQRTTLQLESTTSNSHRDQCAQLTSIILIISWHIDARCCLNTLPSMSFPRPLINGNTRARRVAKRSTPECEQSSPGWMNAAFH